MPKLYLYLILGVAFSSATNFSFGQATVEHQMRIDENTQIFDKTTGQRIPYAEYNRMVTENRGNYHLEPVIDEYGKTSSYKLRQTTAEERATGKFRDIDLEDRPKVGQVMPLFVMKGIDGNVYRSTDLKGHVVVLSFWVSLDKPFWNPVEVKELTDIFKPYQPDLISLGVMDITEPEVLKDSASRTLPFIPVPDSYGFHKKFRITTIPTFVVIDKQGNVAAYIEAFENDKLKLVLKTVSK